MCSAPAPAPLNPPDLAGLNPSDLPLHPSDETTLRPVPPLQLGKLRLQPLPQGRGCKSSCGKPDSGCPWNGAAGPTLGRTAGRGK